MCCCVLWEGGAAVVGRKREARISWGGWEVEGNGEQLGKSGVWGCACWAEKEVTTGVGVGVGG